MCGLRASLVVRWERIHLQYRRHRRGGFDPWVGKIPLEEEMATHSSVLVWRIPWTGGLWSIGCRVGQD